MGEEPIMLLILLFAQSCSQNLLPVSAEVHVVVLACCFSSMLLKMIHRENWKSQE